MINPKEFIDESVKKIKDQIGDEKAVIALSGGVDSSVCSVLVFGGDSCNGFAAFFKFILCGGIAGEQFQNVCMNPYILNVFRKFYILGVKQIHSVSDFKVCKCDFGLVFFFTKHFILPCRPLYHGRYPFFYLFWSKAVKCSNNLPSVGSIVSPRCHPCLTF